MAIPPNGRRESFVDDPIYFTTGQSMKTGKSMVGHNGNFAMSVDLGTDNKPLEATTYECNSIARAVHLVGEMIAVVCSNECSPDSVTCI